MSVSLLEVIEGAGYNLTKKDDCQWLLSKVAEFEELVTAAEDLLEAEEERETAESEAKYKLAFPEEE